MKRFTQNRIEILRCLTEGNPDCGLPPYSVSSIHYMLYGLDFETPKTQRTKVYRSQCGQIRRTLNDLANDGLVIMGREKMTEANGLPYWENVYQITAMAEQNHFEKELRDIDRTISNAYTGIGALFGVKSDGEGLTATEIAELTHRVKGIIQKTHPDKGGNECQFMKMKGSLDMLRKMPVKLNG